MAIEVGVMQECIMGLANRTGTWVLDSRGAVEKLMKFTAGSSSWDKKKRFTHMLPSPFGQGQDVESPVLPGYTHECQGVFFKNVLH